MEVPGFTNIQELTLHIQGGNMGKLLSTEQKQKIENKEEGKGESWIFFDLDNLADQALRRKKLGYPWVPWETLKSAVSVLSANVEPSTSVNPGHPDLPGLELALLNPTSRAQGQELSEQQSSPS